MTREEILAVAAAYADETRDQHLDAMAAQMRDFSYYDANGKARDKLNRWLGFMQGVLHERGVYTLEELKSHNKGTSRPGHPPTDKCPDQECSRCGKRDCPWADPLHYHHDGCPSCVTARRKALTSPEAVAAATAALAKALEEEGNIIHQGTYPADLAEIALRAAADA